MYDISEPFSCRSPVRWSELGLAFGSGGRRQAPRPTPPPQYVPGYVVLYTWDKVFRYSSSIIAHFIVYTYVHFKLGTPGCAYHRSMPLGFEFSHDMKPPPIRKLQLVPFSQGIFYAYGIMVSISVCVCRLLHPVTKYSQ